MLSLKHILSEGLSASQVSSLYARGFIGTKTYRHYGFLWTWGVPRFENNAGRRQDGFVAKRGDEALRRRFTRTQAIVHRIING